MRSALSAWFALKITAQQQHEPDALRYRSARGLCLPLSDDYREYARANEHLVPEAWR
ncbi:MAG TPA: hypothetical protein VJL59_01420 [Anaerolineales bacterium]|nr:hypothetical protein [Anaerolineales bacterium]